MFCIAVLVHLVLFILSGTLYPLYSHQTVNDVADILPFSHIRRICWAICMHACLSAKTKLLDRKPNTKDWLTEWLLGKWHVATSLGLLQFRGSFHFGFHSTHPSSRPDRVTKSESSNHKLVNFLKLCKVEWSYSNCDHLKWLLFVLIISTPTRRTIPDNGF